MNATKCAEIFHRFAAASPSPTTELHYRTPFELLVAVILSAQATDKSVNRATSALFAAADTPEKINMLKQEELETYIRIIGLYRSKARYILATCRQLIAQHDSQVPSSRKLLEKLPGVGRKTANVILNTAFGHPTIAVDTHIFRVANRTGIAPGKTVYAVECQLLKNIPRKFHNNAHHWLILHGRYICKARKPACADCLIQTLCEYATKSN